MAIAARMAMMMTTIISSISVKPCCLRAIGALLFSVMGKFRDTGAGRKANSDTRRGCGDGRHRPADGLPAGPGGVPEDGSGGIGHGIIAGRSAVGSGVGAIVG